MATTEGSEWTDREEPALLWGRCYKRVAMVCALVLVSLAGLRYVFHCGEEKRSVVDTARVAASSAPSCRFDVKADAVRYHEGYRGTVAVWTYLLTDGATGAQYVVVSSMHGVAIHPLPVGDGVTGAKERGGR